MNEKIIGITNYSYWGYVHQFCSPLGPPHCRYNPIADEFDPVQPARLHQLHQRTSFELGRPLLYKAGDGFVVYDVDFNGMIMSLGFVGN